MILMFMVISAFANMMYILNEQRIYEGTQELFEPKVESTLIDSWISMYLLSLGEFELHNFYGVNNGYIWVIFLMATFVIQITFLNMLIAIMSNTYETVKDRQHVATMR